MKKETINNSMAPLASIIVLTYNQQELISRALDSLVAQETNFPYEIIVCDDCSSDNTSQIVMSYATIYPQIVAQINPQNIGLVANTKLANSLARGKYLAVCAGDDYWVDNLKLQKQVDILESNPEVALVYTDAIVDAVHFEKRYVRRCANPQADLFNQLLRGCFITAPTVCFSRMAMKHVNYAEYAENKFIMEDYPAYLDLASKYKFYHLPDVTVNYRVDRITPQNVERALLDSCVFASETLRVQKYYINKYPNLAKIESSNLEDAYYHLCYKNMLFLKKKKEALLYLRLLHTKSLYERLMILLLSMPLGPEFYYWYYRKKHPNTSPVSLYFGGESCE